MKDLLWARAGTPGGGCSPGPSCAPAEHGHRSCPPPALPDPSAPVCHGLARKVGMMGLHHQWERKELSWVACCPSKCPEAGLWEDHKDSYPSWILDEWFYFPKYRVVAVSGKVSKLVPDKTIFSEGLELKCKRQNIRHSGYVCTWYIMEKCYEGRTRGVQSLSGRGSDLNWEIIVLWHWIHCSASNASIK